MLKVKLSIYYNAHTFYNIITSAREGVIRNVVQMIFFRISNRVYGVDLNDLYDVFRS